MRYFTTTDPKIARIEHSWFAPSRRQAAWLASIADEVRTEAIASASTPGFVYLPLGVDGGSDPGSALAIARSHVDLVIERIPEVERALARVALAA